ncbi:MAG: hypothetical protein WBD40_10645 [Tepidisphaeraceae bacterium]
MAVDKLEWHASADDFPITVTRKSGATHIGMFVDWALSRSLMSEQISRFSPLRARLFRCGIISGRTFIAWFCDGAFSSGNHLNTEGHDFTEAYYDRYLADYEAIFAGEYATIYHVAYSQTNRRAVANLLDDRLAAWQASDRVDK